MAWALIPVAFCLALFFWVFRPAKLADIPAYSITPSVAVTLEPGQTFELFVTPITAAEGKVEASFFLVVDETAEPFRPRNLEGDPNRGLRFRTTREDLFGKRTGTFELVCIVARPEVTRDFEAIAKRGHPGGPGWQRLSVPVTLTKAAVSR